MSTDKRMIGKRAHGHVAVGSDAPDTLICDDSQRRVSVPCRMTY